MEGISQTWMPWIRSISIGWLAFQQPPWCRITCCCTLTLETLNQAIQKVIQHGTPAAFDQLLEVFSQRRAFIGQQGQVNLRGMLNMYGGKRLIHGHTPISKVTGELARSITMAHVYQDGACVNIDGGMYLGGPGFLYVAK